MSPFAESEGSLPAAGRFVQSGLFVVPLDCDGAVRYFNHALRSAHGIGGRVLACAGSLAPIPGPRIRFGLDDRTGPEWLLADRLQTHAARLGLALPFRWIVMRDYDDSARLQTVAFLFSPAGEGPLAVAKLRLARGSGRRLRSEAEALSAVRRTLTAELRRTIPTILLFETDEECELLVVSALRGVSAYTQMQTSLVPSAHLARHFSAASSWLAAFQTATAGAACDPAADSAAVPLTASHGDYWARNLLIESAAASGVVDWEHFAPSASPFIDLFHYPLTYGLNFPWTMYRRATNEVAFSKTFLERTRVAKAVRLYLEDYAARMGLNRGTLASAFRLFLRTRGTMDGTRRPAELPWARFEEMFDRAASSVFSG